MRHFMALRGFLKRSLRTELTVFFVLIAGTFLVSACGTVPGGGDENSDVAKEKVVAAKLAQAKTQGEEFGFGGQLLRQVRLGHAALAKGKMKEFNKAYSDAAVENLGIPGMGFNSEAERVKLIELRTAEEGSREALVNQTRMLLVAKRAMRISRARLAYATKSGDSSLVKAASADADRVREATSLILNDSRSLRSRIRNGHQAQNKLADLIGEIEDALTAFSADEEGEREEALNGMTGRRETASDDGIPKSLRNQPGIRVQKVAPPADK